jgi:hypothetical protein
MNNCYWSRLCVSVVATIVMSCSQTLLEGGSGSTTTNGLIKGQLLDSTGNPAAHVVVQLLPFDYNPVKDAPLPDSLTDTTNESGAYRFRAPEKNTYNLQARQETTGFSALVTGLFVYNNENINVAAQSLERPGALRVLLPDSLNMTDAYIYIPGTTLFAFPGSACIPGVPAGSIPSVNYARLSALGSKVVKTNIPIASGDTASVFDNGVWAYSKKLFMNTTATGANVTGDITGFPLLVRLNNNMFNFNEANKNDLRFMKADGSSLAFEIEGWDPAAGQATVWVRVDTVYGNNATQYILMYWGNPDAAGLSNGAAVFDTSNGFVGVWHLDENGDSVADATGNAFNGKKYGSTMVPGLIGNSALFANGDYMQIAGLLNRPSNVTLSAWVLSDTSAGRGQDIVSIGDAALIRFDDVNGLGAGGFYHDNPVVNDSMYGRTASGRYLSKSGWHYLAFSINTTTNVQAFYIDGVLCATTHDVNPIFYDGVGADTYIGKNGNNKTTFNFIGQIDEVRVNNYALDPDWIKLCFMNQKAQDALIVW